jgi:hypothetical protein
MAAAALAVPQVAPLAQNLSKRAQLASLVANVPASDPRSDSALARDLAPAIGLHPGTARRYISDLRKAAQTGADGGARATVPIAA